MLDMGGREFGNIYIYNYTTSLVYIYTTQYAYTQFLYMRKR